MIATRDILSGLFFSVVLLLTFAGLYSRRITLKIALPIIVFSGFIAATIMRPWDRLGIMCIGSQIAFSFGLITLGYGFAIKKWGGKQEKIKDE